MIMTITDRSIQEFANSLYNDEKSSATVSKYIRAVERLALFLSGTAITKRALLEYRDDLLKNKKSQTVNGVLSAINSYLNFRGLSEFRVRLLRIQRKAFLEESKELLEKDYKQLLTTAKECGNERMYMLMQTLCATGIRISELSYITVEAVKHGSAEIRLKGKTRVVILQKELCRKLLNYAQKYGIENGFLFRTKSGKPMDRSNIHHAMKKICLCTKVEPCKVFPHSFRHLFARTFYAVEKNLAHLSDVLGHSCIETTRLYVAVSASAHERILNKMKLLA